MGKVHGGLARAGKVKSHTPKIDKKEKRKSVVGRAKKRLLYNKRHVNPIKGKKGPNTQPIK